MGARQYGMWDFRGKVQVDGILVSELKLWVLTTYLCRCG